MVWLKEDPYKVSLKMRNHGRQCSAFIAKNQYYAQV